MKTSVQKPSYWVEMSHSGYEVHGLKGFYAVFADLEMAVQAARDFSEKHFPKQWSKVPPAMARLCGRER